MAFPTLLRAVTTATLLMIALPSFAEARGGFVSAEGTRLKLNGGDFYFSGANSYSMLYSEEEAEAQFEIAASLGLNAIRLWGFWNGEAREPQLDEKGNVVRPAIPDTDIHGRYVLQSRPRRYVEQGFLRLDYVIYLAHMYNMKLIIPLLNEWPEFGGIDQYLRWAGVVFPPMPDGHCARESLLRTFRDRFWTNREAIDIYYDYIEYVLNRVNTITGVAYKDDPAIMIWEIMNEPRYGSWAADQTGGMVIRDFIAQTSAFIKSMDRNHLVGTGEEGFMKREDISLVRRTYPWTCAAGEGLDWVANGQVDGVDVLSIHAWPFQWGLWGDSRNDTAEDQLGEYPDLAAFIPEWVDEHLRAAGEIGKPLYMGEFGFQILRVPGSDLPERDAILQAAYDHAATTDIAGMMYWNMVASHDPEQVAYRGSIERRSRLQSWYSDAAVPHDTAFSFDVFCPEDESTCAIIKNYSLGMVAKVKRPDAAGRTPAWRTTGHPRPGRIRAISGP